MADNSKYYILRGDKVLTEGMTKEQIYNAITQAVEQGEIGDIDKGFITSIKEQNHNIDLKIWRGTQAEYNALSNIDENTYYILTDGIPPHTHTEFKNDLTVEGNLTAQKDVTAKSLSTSNEIEAGSNISAGADITAGWGVKSKTLQVSGNNTDATKPLLQAQIIAVDVNGYLNVANNAKIDEQLYVKKNAYLWGGLEALGDITLGGNVAITGDSNSVSGISAPDFRYVVDVNKQISFKQSEIAWKKITLESGISTQSYGGASTPMYRKVGDRVDIIGAVKATWDGSNQIVVGTLPTGYRPKNVHLWIAAAQGSQIARVNITQNGVLRIEYIRNISDGSAVTTERWVELNTSFFIV